MRKDVKFGLTIGGILVATVVVYVMVLSGTGNASSDKKPTAIEKTAAPSGSSQPLKSDARTDLTHTSASGGGSSLYGGQANGGSPNRTNAQSPSTGLRNPGTGMLGMNNSPGPSTGGSSLTGLGTPSRQGLENVPTSRPTQGQLAQLQTPNSIIPPINRSGPLPQSEPDRTITPTQSRADELARQTLMEGHPMIDGPAMLAAPGADSAVHPSSPLNNSSNPGGSSGPSRLTSPIPGTPVDRTHVIAAHETLWTIAAAVYGNGALSSKIVAANQGLDPKHLKVGQTLIIPALNATERSAASSSANGSSPSAPAVTNSATQYKVTNGDTLQRIARRLYGSADMADKIYDLNKTLIGSDPNRLKIGWILKLPQPPTVATR